MIGWTWHLVEVSRCWEEERWLVWNGCVKVVDCESRSSRKWKGSVIDGAVKTCVGVWFVTGGVYAVPWSVSCDVGGGDGVCRARGGGGALVVGVAVEKCWDELELDQLAVKCWLLLNGLTPQEWTVAVCWVDGRWPRTFARL